ncbi:hypothetical protein SESBI_12824 [Sesbania bispinosa]|nr:hypothetical protein SESBI_12824 [Sesbania bispinosa]
MNPFKEKTTLKLKIFNWPHEGKGHGHEETVREVMKATINGDVVVQPKWEGCSHEGLRTRSCASREVMTEEV